MHCDHGSDSIAPHPQRWLNQAQGRKPVCRTGRLWKNGHNESFKGTVRDECIQGEVFANVLEARSATAIWRDEYRPRR